jgi:hypothetical protein
MYYLLRPIVVREGSDSPNSRQLEECALLLSPNQRFPVHGGIGSGMGDGSGIGIGAKPSSWVLTFMAPYYLDNVCGSEASNSSWHLRCLLQ